MLESYGHWVMASTQYHYIIFYSHENSWYLWMRLALFFFTGFNPILISNIHPLIHRLPSGYVKIAMENGTFIVDLPIKDGDFP